MQYEDGLGHALNLGAPVTFPLCRTRFLFETCEIEDNA